MAATSPPTQRSTQARLRWPPWWRNPSWFCPEATSFRCVSMRCTPAAAWSRLRETASWSQTGRRSCVGGSDARALDGRAPAPELSSASSGIATLTSTFVRAAGGRRASSTPARRLPACDCSSGRPCATAAVAARRNDLGSAVLIKDNHIAAAGSVTVAIERARAHAPHTSRIEIEVTTQADSKKPWLPEPKSSCWITSTTTPYALPLATTRGRALLEVSGNVQLERVSRLAEPRRRRHQRWGADALGACSGLESAPSRPCRLEAWSKS